MTRTQSPPTLSGATALTTAVAKVNRPPETWRRMYVVETVGTALWRGIRENA